MGRRRKFRKGDLVKIQVLELEDHLLFLVEEVEKNLIRGKVGKKDTSFTLNNPFLKFTLV